MIAGFALAAMLYTQQSTIEYLNDLGRISLERGRLREAQSAFERALDLQSGQASTHALALTLNNLGVLYTKLNLLHRAETTLARAIEIHRSLADRDGQAQSLLNLGSVYRAENRPEQAADLFRQSLVLSTREDDIAAAANNLAVALEDLQRFEEAEPLLLRALSIWEQAAGAEHPRVASARHNLGVLYARLGRLKEAESRLSRAVEIAARVLPPDHPDLAGYRLNYAYVLRKLDRKKEARDLEAAARASRQRFDHDNALGFTVDARQSYR